MALKFRIALYLAMFTGLLTLFLSFIYGVRAINAFYRGAFTACLFFALGYIIGTFAEAYLKKLFEQDAHRGKKIDITDKPDSDIVFSENAADMAASGTEFKPLNPDDFMSIPR